MIVHSPSNLKMFRECPYKYEQIQIKKKYKREATPALNRGIKLHSWMESAIRDGWDSIEWLDNKTRDTAYGAWLAVRRLQQTGWEVGVEVERAIDGRGRLVDWWDKPPLNWLRCKLDVLAVSPDKKSGVVIDWKTGRPWDDELQLMCNVMCAATGTQVHRWHVMYYYLDSGVVRDYHRTVKSTVYRGPDGILPDHGDVVISCIDGVHACLDEGIFPKNRNRFCTTCIVEDCEFYKPQNLPLKERV